MKQFADPDGSPGDPYEITWPKRMLTAYDPITLNSGTYHPTAINTLPGETESIGVTPGNQTYSGMVLGSVSGPTLRGPTVGRFNRIELI
ncbi:MAG: hypothetical protein V3T30_02410 [Thermodesulfobacteriota bacterium]